MTEIVRLDGNIRKNFGSSVTRKLRKNDRLPAVIYGEDSNENTFIDLDIKSFEKEYYKGGIETKIFEINIEGKTYELLCYQVDLEPVSDRPRHVDFISIKNKKQVKVLIPLKFINSEKSPGLKRGGYLNVMYRKLQVLCDPRNIPNLIEIDCGSLRLRQSIKISDLKLPEGVKAVSKKDLMLVRIIGRGKDDLDTTTSEATGTSSTVQQNTGSTQQQTTTDKK